jgi:hypothetical protein
MGTPSNWLQTFVMHWSALDARRPEAGAQMTMSVDVA